MFDRILRCLTVRAASIPGLTLMGLMFMPCSVCHAQILISEFVADNSNGLQDEDSGYEDWIELYNASTQTVDLAGWSLTDDPNDLTQWTFPSVLMAPNTYLVVFASSKDRTNALANLHTNFRLSSNGEYLALVDPSGTNVVFDYAPAFPLQFTDVSYGIIFTEETNTLLYSASPATAFVPQDDSIGTNWIAPSFTDAGWTQGITGVGYDTGSSYDPLVNLDLEEDMHNEQPGAYLRIPFEVDDPTVFDRLVLRMKYDDGFSAWINGISVASSNAPDPLLWNSSATQINVDSRALVYEDFIVQGADVILTSGTNLLAIHGLNQSAGSSDFLIMPEIKGVRNPDSDASLLRFFSAATPGTNNAPPRSQLPVFSVPGGLYTDPFLLDIQGVASNSVVRYTLDGSEPTPGSTPLTSPLTITGPMTIRAAAFDPGLDQSLSVLRQYTFIETNLLSFSSDLPLLVINTFGDEIENNALIPSQAVLIEGTVTHRATLTNTPSQTGLAGIKVRGSSTQNQDKNQYALEWQDDTGEDLDVPMLGLPAESDWVLHAPFNYDRALMRNALTYELSRRIGQYAPRTRFMEVYVNEGGGVLTENHYQGVYVLVEKIKRGNDRVDIEGLSAAVTNEPDISGGYIFKIDRADPGDGGFYAGGQTLRYVDPKEEDINQEQADWIKQYIDDFNTALQSTNAADPETGYAAYIETDTWIDHNLINVLTMNVDALRLSTYMYKDRGGKIVAGPVWDFDRSMDSTDGRDDNPEVWRGGDDSTGYFTYGWWDGLFNDPAFNQAWIDRWFELRQTTFSLTNLYALIDGYESILQEAQARNFDTWTSKPPRSGWTGEIARLKGWLEKRVHWIDDQFVQPPQWSPPGGPVTTTTTNIVSGLGTLYYTLDGVDPLGSSHQPSPSAQAVELETRFVDTQSVYKAHVPQDGSLGLTWNGSQPGFDDSGWLSGNGPVGFDIETNATSIIHQDFDSAGYPYTTRVEDGNDEPDIRSGGPAGDYMRLLDGGKYDRNLLSFRRPRAGDVVRAEIKFSFRITPNSGQADGLAFALIRSDTYGALDSEGFNFGPEPNLNGPHGASLGIGLDVYRNSGDPNNNHISLHFGSEQAEDRYPGFDFSDSDFHQFEMTADFTNQTVTVRLIRDIYGSATPYTVFSQYPIPGLSPADIRPAFSADTGGQSARFDLDDIEVSLTYDESSVTLPFSSPFKDQLAALMIDSNASAYIRSTFSVSAPGDYTNLWLEAEYEDGFSAFLNGVSIDSNNSPASLNWNSSAGSDIRWFDSDTTRITTLSSFLGQLQAGSNVLALQALNANAPEMDLKIITRLSGQRPAELVFTNSTYVRSRSLRDDGWSAPSDFVYHLNPLVVSGQLAVSEINYNPYDPQPNEINAGFLDADEFEFIELMNISTQRIDLTGARFSEGIGFTFEGLAGLNLAPQDRIVLVSNPEAFGLRYPAAPEPTGQYDGNLSNGGETITLLNTSHQVLIDFTYNDKGGWPGRADGDGFSLELDSVGESTSNEKDWRASSEYGGTPGTAGLGTFGAIIINETLTHTDLDEDWIELYNPGPDTADLSGWLLSDQETNIVKYIIPSGTVMPPNSYRVFRESDFNDAGSSNVVIPFAVSELGEELILVEATSNQFPIRRHDYVDFGAAKREVTFGTYRKSNDDIDFTTLAWPTPGASNSPPLIGPVVISEIMYHPESNGVEYIELHNISTNNIALYDVNNPSNTWALSGAVDFIFPTNQILTKGRRTLIVAIDPPYLFRPQYQVPDSVAIFGPFDGALNNSGESIKLRMPGDPEQDGFVPQILVDRVDYDDEHPWPVEADGTGPSLERIDSYAYGNNAINWRAVNAPGSPGTRSQVDEDGDMIPDSWEEIYLGDPQDPDHSDSDDPDGDFRNNLQEFIEGTHPGQGTHHLAIRIERTNDQIRASFPTLPAEGPGYYGLVRTYDLERGTNLQSQSWVPVTGYTNLPGSGTLTEYTVPQLNTSLFYRVRTHLTPESP